MPKSETLLVQSLPNPPRRTQRDETERGVMILLKVQAESARFRTTRHRDGLGASAHNPEVAGSNPAPATNERRPWSARFLTMALSTRGPNF